MTRHKWVCGLCSSAVLGSARPRLSATERYCLDCSAQSGSLVRRVCPVLEQQRERARVRAAAKRERGRSREQAAERRKLLGQVQRLRSVRRYDEASRFTRVLASVDEAATDASAIKLWRGSDTMPDYQTDYGGRTPRHCTFWLGVFAVVGFIESDTCRCDRTHVGPCRVRTWCVTPHSLDSILVLIDRAEAAGHPASNDLRRRLVELLGRLAQLPEVQALGIKSPS
jgi:hypothetical protein